MKSEGKVECLNELSKIISSDELHFEDINRISKDFFEKYIEVLHIGKVEILSCVPRNIYDLRLVENKIIAYEGLEVSEEYIKIDSIVNNTDNGYTNILIYPIKDYRFDDEEEKFVLFVVSLFHLYFSKIKLEELIDETKYKDPVTNIYNMIGLNKFFYQRQNSEPYVYVFSNLKNFKYINSIYNRRDADEILRKYAESLSSILDSDEAVCRPGGDNFISVVKAKNFDNYLRLLEHVTFEYMGKNVDIYSTIGYYENVDGVNPNNAVELASNAYGIAKRQKLNVFKYTEEISKKLMHEKSVKAEIINALKNDEMINYYQPKVIGDVNQLYGAEALVRWNKNGNIICPSEFISIIENENMIIDLDFTVLIRTCKDIRDWLDLGIEPVKISINFSTKHLYNEDTVDRIISIIDEYKIDHKYIEIELTELTNFSDISKMEKFINSLHENKISVSMDDFGSGYSSMRLLKNLDYDIVKIDKGLVDSIENGNEKDLTILRNIINMLSELNIGVVAEGVESQKQLDIIKSYGCNIVQGYYYDKPLNEKDFIKKLKKRIYE